MPELTVKDFASKYDTSSTALRRLSPNLAPNSQTRLNDAEQRELCKALVERQKQLHPSLKPSRWKKPAFWTLLAALVPLAIAYSWRAYDLEHDLSGLSVKHSQLAVECERLKEQIGQARDSATESREDLLQCHVNLALRLAEETGSERQALGAAVNALSLDPLSEPGLQALDAAVQAYRRCWPLPEHESFYPRGSVSPSGRFVATGGGDGSLQIVDLETGEVDVSREHEDGILDALFSPATNTLVTNGRDKKVIVQRVSLRNGALVRHSIGYLENSDATVNHVAINHRDDVATACADGRLRLWRGGNYGANPHSSFALDGAVVQVAFSKAGELLVGATVRGVLVTVNLQSGNPRMLKTGIRIRRIALSDDGKYLVVFSIDGMLHVLDTNSLEEVSSIGPGIKDLTFVRGGTQVLLAGPDRYVSTASFPQLNGMRTLGTHSRRLSAVTQRAGIVATGGYDRKVRLWRLASDTPDEVVLEPAGILQGHRGRITQLLFARPDRLVSVAEDRVVRVWSVPLPNPSQVLVAHGPKKAQALCARFSPGNRPERLLTTSQDGTVRIWTRGSDQWTTEKEWSHGDIVLVGEFSADGALVATGSYDGTAAIWDTTRKERPLRVEHGAQVWWVAFDAPGKRLATFGSDGAVRLWSVATGAELDLPVEARHGSLLFGGRFFSSFLWSWGQSERVFAISVDGGNSVVEWKHDDFVRSVAFSTSRKLIASGGDDRRVRLFSWNGLAERQIWDTVTDHEVWHVTFSRDSAFLAAAQKSGVALLWGGENLREAVRLDGHDDLLRRVAFSADGSLMMACSDDGVASVWETNTARLLGRLTGHNAIIRWCEFARTGKTAATAGYDGTVRLWDLRDWGSRRSRRTRAEVLKGAIRYADRDLQERLVRLRDEFR